MSEPRIEVKKTAVWPVVLTPFNQDRSIDHEGLKSLVDFYLNNGATGLLGSCWSSETAEMTFSEALSTITTIIDRVGGKVPVAATPHSNDTEPVEMKARVSRLFDAGVDIVVLVASRFAQENESEEVLLSRLMDVVDAVPKGRFGVYESPAPYHRLLSAEGMRRLAQSGRFEFHKDTACDLKKIQSKIAAVAGTPLKFYNANTPTLLDSLKAGGDGYCGVGTNFFPEIYAELCRSFSSDPEKAQRLQDFLVATEKWGGNDSYPKNAKIFLAQKGLPIQDYCRINRDINDEQRGFLKCLADARQQLDL